MIAKLLNATIRILAALLTLEIIKLSLNFVRKLFEKNLILKVEQVEMVEKRNEGVNVGEATIKYHKIFQFHFENFFYC